MELDDGRSANVKKSLMRGLAAYGAPGSVRTKHCGAFGVIAVLGHGTAEKVRRASRAFTRIPQWQAAGIGTRSTRNNRAGRIYWRTRTVRECEPKKQNNEELQANCLLNSSEK